MKNVSDVTPLTHKCCLQIVFAEFEWPVGVELRHTVVHWLSASAGADPPDGHVLRTDGQPHAQRLPTDALCQSAHALRRSILIHMHQPAALPHELPLHGPPSPGQGGLPQPKHNTNTHTQIF